MFDVPGVASRHQAEHLPDWFHLTTRIIVMAKSLRPPYSGEEVEVEGGHDGTVVGFGI